MWTKDASFHFTSILELAYWSQCVISLKVNNICPTPALFFRRTTINFVTFRDCDTLPQAEVLCTSMQVRRHRPHCDDNQGSGSLQNSMQNVFVSSSILCICNVSGPETVLASSGHMMSAVLISVTICSFSLSSIVWETFSAAQFLFMPTIFRLCLLTISVYFH